MKRCIVNRSALWIALVLSGCGSHVIDAGHLPEVGAAGTSGAAGNAGADAGNSSSNTPQGNCTVPDLDRYRIVFDSDGGKLERRIYSMRADGSDLQPLTPADEFAREPAVSPDGTQLAYTTPEGIKLMQLDSGEAELIVPGADWLTWSRDGSRIVYRIDRSYFASVHLPDRVEDTDMGLIAATSRADFSVDDSALLYASNNGDIGAPKYALGTYDFASHGGAELVAGSATPVTHPTLSPDGVWVAAAYDCPGSDRSSLWASPYSVTTPACEGRRITHSDAVTATNPNWGPGVLITYERGEPPRDIAIVAADTGDECVLPGLGDERNPSWFPELPSDVR